MDRERIFRFLIVVAAFFCAAGEALSWAAANAQAEVRDIAVSDIFISPELGYVVEAHPPSVKEGAKLIVHIQEAHINYEAQKSLVGILEGLIKKHALKLIFVEGGEQDVGLAYMRSYGPPENRKQVAEKYLKSGIISGEEYLDIASDYPLILWGVEQKELYEQHVEAFMDSEQLAKGLRPAVSSVLEAVETLKPKLQDPNLNELEAKAKAFDEDRLGLSEYAGFLLELARRNGIAPDLYPGLSRFQYVQQLEKAIDLAKVQPEQRALVESLGLKLEASALDGLVEKARQMKDGAATREDFYEELEKLLGLAGLNLEGYPNLSGYMRYLKRRAQIKPTSLAKELEQLASSLRSVLASNPASRKLQEIAQQAGLIEKLLDLRLSPQEYQQLQSLNMKEAFAGWERFLNEQLSQQGLSPRSFPGLGELAASLPRQGRFYQAAQERDGALVANAMKKLSQSNERLAVLITGGFHSPRITQLLKEHGVGVVVVAPKVSSSTDDRLYHAVLKYKSGHGSFEEVMALASQTTDEPREKR